MTVAGGERVVRPVAAGVPAAGPSAALAGAAALLCVAVVLLHRVGEPGGGVGSAPAATRWSDWVQLVSVHAVVVAACAGLRAVQASRAAWVVGLLGSGLFLQGQGVHLAAVSSSRVVGDQAPVPLWHAVGEVVWWLGAALLVVALARPHLAAQWRPRLDVPVLLVVGVLAMVATHWLRLLPLGYGGLAAIRYEDLVDLLTPYVVAGPLLLVLARLDAGRRDWGLALLGSALFTSGQGLHLSSNSIVFTLGKQDPADLWDEHVGHHLWFGGLALLLLVVVRRLQQHPVAVPSLAWLLVPVVALTWAANVVEGGMVPVGSALALVLVAQGWSTRGTASGRLLAATFALSLVLVLAWGAWQGGFPQPSELGWL